MHAERCLIKPTKCLIIIFVILAVINILGCRNKYESGKKYYFLNIQRIIMIKEHTYPHMPYKPLEEVEYKYLENWTYREYYYAGIFNKKDNLVQFEEWDLSRKDVKIEKYLPYEAITGLMNNLYPALYYSIKKEKGIEKPNEQIDIKAAEELSKYFRLTFDKKTQELIQQKITKKRMSVHTYVYYANGNIKEIKFIRSDGIVTHHSLYDKKGEKLMDYNID